MPITRVDNPSPKMLVIYFPLYKNCTTSIVFNKKVLLSKQKVKKVVKKLVKLVNGQPAISELVGTDPG